MLFDLNQRIAVNKLRNGNILCGKVGSGKSRVSLTYFFEKECGGSIEPPYSSLKEFKDLYIITTARKRDTKEWEKEIEAFDMFETDKIKVTIDSWNNISKYVNVKNSFFIFDEQKVIGSGTWVESFYKITSSQRYINNGANNDWILLSATPGDKWEDYIPVFVANKFYRNKSEFMSLHAVFNPFTPYQKVERFVGVQKLEALKQRLLVNIKVKSNHRTYEYIKIPYNEEMYKKVAKTRWDIFTNNPIETASMYCYILRKVVNMNDDRLKALLNVFDRHKKVIVFYNFDYERDILRIMCHRLGITKAEWNGHKHELIPDTDSWLYLVQYTAGAEGWNCTKTNVIVFFSLSYSYKATEQAAGRIDRRDTQFTDLNYYFILTDSPIDRAIKKSLHEKKEFNVLSFAKNLAP